FKSKKDIETYGLANFVNKCKERVTKYSSIQTEQSKRLGYFMDWDNSYFTMSDENNYAIWNFLKVCWENGWIYKGHESIPWCPRCETAISQHEILTEDYRELTHESVYLRLPIVDRQLEYLLVWTTTPWTIPANVAVALDPKIDYSLVKNGDGSYWVATALTKKIFPAGEITKTVKGQELVGLHYKGPYDYLEAVNLVAGDNFHLVVATDDQLMPVTTEEGTGLVHTAVSAGEEDFRLGKKIGLPMIPVIADNADYLPGLDDLSGKNAKNDPRLILNFLEDNGWAVKIEKYKHRYPVCWRCKTELVWKVADEWYISMEKLRPQIMALVKKIKWLPEFGEERELDWLRNMHDWLISKKNRYWGLALPIYECQSCGHFEVIGSKEELEKRAVAGWEKFAGNTPHRPWIDEVKIKCAKCGEIVSRILDVGNPWLDAGIVSVSTMAKGWFPADFITESFPGQFKNWFYSLLVMGTVLKKTNPFKTVLGYASLLDEKGAVMHKSLGNMIEFVEGADKIGVDVMRWMFVTSNPYDNLLFGYHRADETRRRFFLTLWNVYSYFVTYARIAKWQPGKKGSPAVLDNWILSRLSETVSVTTGALESYDAKTASLAIEDFVSDLSLWYIRRSRDRVGTEFFATCYEVLTTLCKLLAPFTPFIAEEIYKNLTGEESVHLASWPEVKSQKSKVKTELISQMELVRKICELGHAKRKEAGMKVRQPLGKFTIYNLQFSNELTQLIKDELNVKSVEFKPGKELKVELDTKLTPELIAEGQARELVRQIQEARKEAGTALDQKVVVTLPDWPKEFTDYITSRTLATKIVQGAKLSIS
ncbi:class I tRNA ligase family protein, partial [Candidatus Microgenomates bacterium]|nr:class I tRNA ligase family protein [Candidatus Microgenomates bacterium]